MIGRSGIKEKIDDRVYNITCAIFEPMMKHELLTVIVSSILGSVIGALLAIKLLPLLLGR